MSFPIPFHAAAIQMVSGFDLAENLATADRLVGEAAAAGAKLVVLPEYFCFLGSRDTDKLALAEPFGAGPLQHACATMARQHQVWLLAGTLPLSCDRADRVTNTALLFDDHGHCTARYDKIHLFQFQQGKEAYNEANTLLAGQTPCVVDTPFGRLAIAVCYDLRFPELFRSLTPFDALLLPAAFVHTTGQAHWEILLRARAIENQCYVIASGQGGHHSNGRHTFGHSMVIDPWGDILNCLPTGPGYAHATLDPEHLNRIRQQLPALNHRVCR